MSGGYFEFQYRIDDIAVEIDKLIASNNDDTVTDWGFPINHGFPPEVLEKFKETAHNLKRCSEMVSRIDYLVEGDDGVESFLRRWNEEVRPNYIYPTQQLN